MRTVSTGIVATGLFLAAGCGVGSDVASGLERRRQSINAKKLQYEAVDITAAPAGQDSWFPVGPSDKAEVYGPASSATRVSGLHVHADQAADERPVRDARAGLLGQQRQR